MSEGMITQQGKPIHYPTLTAREHELQVKNRNLQEYVTALLQRNAELSRRVRELEASR